MNSNSKVTENPQSKKAQIVLFKGEKKRADQSKESKQAKKKGKDQKQEMQNGNDMGNKGNKKPKLSKSTEKDNLDLSAKAYGVYDQQLNPLIEKNPLAKRQIASLTKMMTLLAVLKLKQKFKIQIKTTYFRVSLNAINFMGTMAELDPQQWVTMEDLIYGLMLPSGNDAAIVLAENLGAYLYYQKKGQSKTIAEIKSLDVTNDGSNLKVYLDLFIKYMNQLAKQQGLKDSLFMNPHGLDCKQQSYSTVKDVAHLIKKLMANEIAAKVMGTRNYFARLRVSMGKSNNYRQIDWMNTNRLLWKKGYTAGKTGQTIGALNCLASVYQHEGKKYYIIVLGCNGIEDRFRQTQKLVNKEILKDQ